MKILVIIPAYNEEKSISKVIMDIYNQRIEDLDILVINDASSDNTKF
ncbi:N-glycosyltransferase [Clostridium perfringens]|nr:N-glycosyltransferase [Clostridium perfringens]MDH5061685.1 N-glycosyltransferase [Clostridium perfringens NCTC 8239]MDG6879977.1 N-glycosyltransferase [Clostridium perfringens]MDG6884343.1 N-glycosyltransferase [Clostridium perfringens]MDG6886904.1 N-glycosyltransferase [Clostridium perfringens]